MIPRRWRSPLMVGAFVALTFVLAVCTHGLLQLAYRPPSTHLSTSSFTDILDFHDSILDARTHLDPRNDSFDHVHVTWPKSSKYNTFLGRGCKLYENLERRKSSIPGSSFSEISALDDNGWKLSDPSATTDDRLTQLLKSIESPLKDKGIGITTADGNVNIEATHETTQAKYYEVYNPKLGVLVAYRNYGPAWMKENNEAYKDVELPKLQKWSDIVYLVWAKITNSFQRANLRYVVRLNVQNEDTNDVVSEALKKAGVASGVPPAWPGYTFKPEENSLQPFQVVLGTPNLYGVAYLLLQHAGQMGRKTVKSITVWDKSGMANQDMGWSLCIMVELGDLP